MLNMKQPRTAERQCDIFMKFSYNLFIKTRKGKRVLNKKYIKYFKCLEKSLHLFGFYGDVSLDLYILVNTWSTESDRPEDTR